MNQNGASPKHRGFRLIVETVDPDQYALLLQETNGVVGSGTTVVRVASSQVNQILPTVLDAVRNSGHPKTVLSAQRKKPIVLHEEAGVRLGLVFVATQSISKARRIQEMADSVAAMTVEEVYYWYAKVTGTEGSRLLRSLRLFLSAE